MADVVCITCASRKPDCTECGGRPIEVRYKMADGSLIGDEFTYVGETEWWDDCDEPVELIREYVIVVRSERYTHISPGAQLYLDCLAEAEEMEREAEDG